MDNYYLNMISQPPRLRGGLSLKQKGAAGGFTGIEGRNGVGDPESEEEKVKFSKKWEKN